MGKNSQITADHAKIRQWAEARGGHPVTVKGTSKEGEKVGMLRIDFPGWSGEKSLQEISWEEFFDMFEKKNLALVYEEELDSGEKSRFNKIVSRDAMKEEVSATQKH